jgi:hypothetical protein
MYYGGTTYDNQAGLGVKLPAGAARGDTQALNWPALPQWDFPEDTPLAVPITRIYDRGRTLQSSLLLAGRITPPLAILSAELAASLGAEAGAPLEVTLGGQSYVVRAEINAELPARVVLIPRSVGLPLTGPTPIRLRLAEHAAA